MMWNQCSWINRGLRNTPQAGSFAPAMSAMAQMNKTLSPIRSYNSAGYNTVVNYGDGSTTPLYIVPTPSHPRQPVYIYKGAVGAPPSAWPPGSTYPGAQQANCVAVPVPLGADLSTQFDVFYGRRLEASSSDHHLAIWDPWSDEYWDFQGFATLNASLTWPAPTGVTGTYYGCSQSGYLSSVDRGDGLFPMLADGSISGAAASGIALAAGMITFDDLMAGSIEHQLNLAINCEGQHIAPATRQDHVGGGPWGLVKDGQPDGTYAVPLGAIFRIDPAWIPPPVGDLISAHPDLAQIGLGSNTGQRVTPWHRMLWTAMRDFGFTTMDYSGTVAFTMQGIGSLSTIYSPYSSEQINARMSALGVGGSPGGPAGCAPWSLIQQVQYPV